MASMITVTLLIDAGDTAIAEQTIHKILEQFVDGDIIDFATERVAKSNMVIDDMIVNETYAAGDFSQDWVIFSAEKNKNNTNGYWSDEYGWTDKDLATFYDSEYVKMPEGVDDAVLLMRRMIK